MGEEGLRRAWWSSLLLHSFRGKPRLQSGTRSRPHPPSALWGAQCGDGPPQAALHVHSLVLRVLSESRSLIEGKSHILLNFRIR